MKLGPGPEGRPYTQKERELIAILADALKRAAARWTPSPRHIDAVAEAFVKAADRTKKADDE